MERQKQVVHFQAKKGFTTAQSNEHQRNWTQRGWESANENGRIDRTRVGLNFEVVPEPVHPAEAPGEPGVPGDPGPERGLP